MNPSTPGGQARGARRRSRPRRLGPAALLVVLVLAAIVLVLPAAATAASPSPSASGTIVYRIGLQSDVDNMNPFTTYMGVPWECFRTCYNFITWYDADFNPAPDLADPVPSVENGGVTDGGRVWTFHIRKNVKWSDGQPLTARDIAYTYNRILRQQLSMYTSYFAGVTKVEATDDYTVVITSKKPNAVMTALYVPILPEHIWSKVPDKTVESWGNVPMVSSGPFYVAEVKRGKYVLLKRNPYYKEGFGVEPTVDEVIYELYQTQDSVVADLKTGAIDAAIELDPNYMRSIKGTPGVKVISAPGLGFHELGFNCYQSPKSKGNPLLLDARIRQAITYALDKEAIVSTATEGAATIGSSYISPVQSYFHWTVPEAEQYTYDPAKANQILDDAGYKTGPDGVRVAPNGKPLSFRLAALNEYPMDIAVAKKMVSYLKVVGIEARLQTMSESAFTDANYDNADDDLYLWNWTGDIDPGYMLSVMTTDGIMSSSDSDYSNPEYDKLYLQQAQAVVPAERKAIIDKMQQILYRDAPYDILWYNVLVQAFNTDKWEGYSSVPVGGDGAAFRNMIKDTYLNLKPKTATATQASDSSGTIVAIIVAVAAVAGIVAFVVIRRRPKAVETDE